MSEKTIGVGVVGLGFMGRTHLRAYNAAIEAGYDAKLVAVCDGIAERLDGRDVAEGNIEAGGGGDRLFDPAVVNGYTDPAELFADPAVDVVSICTPTDSHADLSIRAMAAGKHVLVEKPAAVTSEEVERIVAAAAEHDRVCMPAFCMRFWPGWSWLKETIEAGTHGAVRSAFFQRLATPPSWSADFYENAARTGGALVDLHIHDADFVTHCFGKPDAVSSAGDLDHMTTQYRYADGPVHVVAEGGWDHHDGWPFVMRYAVVFERATADFDFSREPKLLVHAGGESTPVELEPWAGYDGEVRHLLERLAAGGRPDVSIAEAADVARLLEAERASLESGAPVAVP